MRDLAGDVRFGARMLLKRRGISALAAIALALGIGLTTTMFSIIEGVILRGLPLDHADRILYVARTTPGRDGGDAATADDFLDWQRAAADAFDGPGRVRDAQRQCVRQRPSERANLASVTPNLFRVLHAVPVAGRDFVDTDGAPGRAGGRASSATACGRRASAARRPVVGRTVRVNGTPTTIVGVMPERFAFPETQDLWQPLVAHARGQARRRPERGCRRTAKAGVTVNQASAELRGIAAELAVEHVENKDVSVSVMSRTSGGSSAHEIVETFAAMLVAVFGVMLIACVNVANLQLARAAERQREVAVRTALGAGRRAHPAAVARRRTAARRGWRAARPRDRERGDRAVQRAASRTPIRRSGSTSASIVVVLAFTTGLTMLATLAGSLVPALRATRQDVNAVLKDEGRGNTGLRIGRFGRGLRRGRSAAVVLSARRLRPDDQEHRQGLEPHVSVSNRRRIHGPRRPQRHAVSR